jgi:hypothetical protein
MQVGARREPFVGGYGITWEDVSAGMKETVPRNSHNDALKWFRECLYATGQKFIDFPPASAVAVRKVVHEKKGKGFCFANESSLWDWRQMLLCLSDDKIQHVFSDRVVRIGVEVREGQPDHSYIVAASDINGVHAVAGMERLQLDRFPCHLIDNPPEVVDFFRTV